jgi:hypothetical protein
MPPQGYVVLGGLAWNYARSRRGKPTISMFARQHRALAVTTWCGLTVWLVPHWWRRAAAAVELVDVTRPHI